MENSPQKGSFEPSAFYRTTVRIHAERNRSKAARQSLPSDDGPQGDELKSGQDAKNSEPTGSILRRPDIDLHAPLLLRLHTGGPKLPPMAPGDLF